MVFLDFKLFDLYKQYGKIPVVFILTFKISDKYKYHKIFIFDQLELTLSYYQSIQNYYLAE